MANNGITDCSLISIIYSDDGSEWNDYLSKCISVQVDHENVHLEVKNIAIDQPDFDANSSNQQLNATHSILTKSNVILVVITPDLLDNLDTKPDLYQLFDSFVADRAIGVLCGIETIDLTPGHKTALVALESWQKLLSVLELGQQFIAQVIANVNQLLIRVQIEHKLSVKLDSNSPVKNDIGLTLVQRKVKEVCKIEIAHYSII